MTLKHEKRNMIFAGLIIGVIASLLVLFGNPKNMGFCIACFLRDTAGGLGLHSAAAVQYIRPEIIGLVLGSFIMAISHKEFSARGGSAPVTRFVLGMFVMVGCLMFLGCPFRMILRLAGGDLNALLGLAGFVCGILAGVFFLNKGYTLKRSHDLAKPEGGVFVILTLVVFALLLLAPAFIHFSEAGAGPARCMRRSSSASRRASSSAHWRSGRGSAWSAVCVTSCSSKETKLILGFAAILVGALVCNLILTGATDASYFHLGVAEQPVAHTDGLWNFLGMLLVGFACVLLGGCPLRQLILAGEGNSDSAITVLGLLAGAAFCHNFGLASSGNGPTDNGKIAVVVGIVVVAVIACVNTFRKESK